MIKLGVLLDVLEHEQKGSSTERSGILCQIVLSLSLGRAHVQQVSCKVGIIKGG